MVLKEVECSNTTAVPALLTEKALLERLQHPAVVGYQSFLMENGCYYLVLEYVPGISLHQLFQSDLAPVEDVVDWALQLCEVFEYLHSQRPPIIYRDLKPENVLLTPEGKIKLIDFGIARVHKGNKDMDTELMGTRSTASPEQFGDAETDARSDIYTMGVTIYEMLTGGRRKPMGPFTFAPVRELRPEVPEALEAVLAKATQMKPSERYQNARSFANAIRGSLGLSLLPELAAPTPEIPKPELPGANEVSRAWCC